MGRPAAAARSLTRQVGRCSSNSDRMRRPLARASTRYSGRSGASAAAEAGRSAADEELAEELAERRAMDGLSSSVMRSDLSLRGPGRTWTAGQRVGYGIQKATFI